MDEQERVRTDLVESPWMNWPLLAAATLVISCLASATVMDVFGARWSEANVRYADGGAGLGVAIFMALLSVAVRPSRFRWLLVWFVSTALVGALVGPLIGYLVYLPLSGSTD